MGYKQSPTLLKQGEEHGYISTQIFLLVRVILSNDHKQIREGLGLKWAVVYQLEEECDPPLHDKIDLPHFNALMNSFNNQVFLGLGYNFL